MTKQEREAIQAKKDSIKNRLLDIYSVKIEKVLESQIFDLSELFEMARKCSDVDDFNDLCFDHVNENSALIIKDLDMVQEYELKQFCKEKGIKI